MLLVSHRLVQAAPLGRLQTTPERHGVTGNRWIRGPAKGRVSNATRRPVTNPPWWAELFRLVCRPRVGMWTPNLNACPHLTVALKSCLAAEFSFAPLRLGVVPGRRRLVEPPLDIAAEAVGR